VDTLNSNSQVGSNSVEVNERESNYIREYLLGLFYYYVLTADK